jgi:uncharacterized RDD family membrane protein YckC
MSARLGPGGVNGASPPAQMPPGAPPERMSAPASTSYAPGYPLPPPPPPGYAYPYRYAGLVARFVAAFIDLIVLLVITIIVTLPFGLMAAAWALTPGAPGAWFGLLYGPFTLLMFGLWILYFTYLEATSGQTLGKRLLNLRVVDPATGRPPSFEKSFVRSILRIVDWLPFLYLLGFIIALVTERKQRLGDLAAGTIVVRT